MIPWREWIWEMKTEVKNSFWANFFITSGSSNQQFQKSSVFEWIVLQRVGFWFNNITTHHVLKFNNFYKIKFCCETRFPKNVNYLRKNVKVACSVGSQRQWIRKKYSTNIFEKESKFDSTFWQSVKLWMQLFTVCQFSNLTFR